MRELFDLKMIFCYLLPCRWFRKAGIEARRDALDLLPCRWFRK